MARDRSAVGVLVAPGRPAAPPASAYQQRAGLARWLGQHWLDLLMVAPLVLYILFFMLVPVGQSIYLSFIPRAAPRRPSRTTDDHRPHPVPGRLRQHPRHHPHRRVDGDGRRDRHRPDAGARVPWAGFSARRPGPARGADSGRRRGDALLRRLQRLPQRILLDLGIIDARLLAAERPRACSRSPSPTSGRRRRWSC